jgi:hypothetical protein
MVRCNVSFDILTVLFRKCVGERSEQTDEGDSPQAAACLRPHPSPVVTAVPLFVTFGDISPRCGENLSLPGEAIIRKNDFREDDLQTLSKRHILCYDKREELLPGGNSPGAAEYIQIYYNPFRPVFPQKPADFVQKEFAS